MFLTSIASPHDAAEIMSTVSTVLTTSDKIEIVGIIVSFVASLIAIIISVITLRQNSKMLEESSRPVISVYSQSMNPGTPMFYLVVKNFGQSTAYMTKFESDFDFSNCYGIAGTRNYIEDLSKCVIAPGQAKACYLDHTKIKQSIHFVIQYKSSVKTYSEEFDVDLTAAACLPTKKFADPDKQLQSISYSLQEMILKDL